MMKKFAIMMITTVFGFAASGIAAGKGESAAQFLRLGVGARGAAMGGAISPVIDDVTALHWNPAGLSQIEKRDISLSYNTHFEDTAAQWVGYAHPTENRGTFGIGLNLFGVKDIDRRSATGGDADVPDLGQFDTQDKALSIGWGNQLGRFHVGSTIKYIASDLETETASAFAIDLGTIWNIGEEEGLAISFAILNLGTEMEFQSESDPLPLNIKPGVAWRMNMGRYGRLLTVLDADLLVNDGLAIVKPGFEWQAHPVFSLRSGYEIGRDEDAGSGFAVGAGFNLVGLSIDYGFVPFGDLGDAHRVTLGYKF